MNCDIIQLQNCIVIFIFYKVEVAVGPIYRMEERIVRTRKDQVDEESKGSIFLYISLFVTFFEDEV